MTTLYIDGNSLTIQQVMDAVHGNIQSVELAPEAAERCRKSRTQINRWLQKDAPVVYGVTTGLGSLKDRALSPEDHVSWNKTIPYPHAVGFEPLVDPAITRAALLLRANVLARSYSAVRVELIERILDVFNAGISPLVYELGSTGLSDLSSLAQSILTVIGDADGEAYYQGKRMSSRQALKEAGLSQSFDLQCKETLAQMNGSTMTQAMAVKAVYQANQLFALQQTLQSGQHSSFFADLQQSADYITQTVNHENNISCDNPLLFEMDNGEFEAVMGCNCSNTQVGYAMDLLALLICDMASHLAIAQPDDAYLRTLVAELRGLTIPASADSISTKANQEDHVEFSFGAARKTMQALERYQQVLARYCSALSAAPAQDSAVPAELSALLTDTSEEKEGNIFHWLNTL